MIRKEIIYRRINLHPISIGLLKWFDLQILTIGNTDYVLRIEARIWRHYTKNQR